MPSPSELEREFTIDPTKGAKAHSVTGYTFGAKEIAPDDPDCIAKKSVEHGGGSARHWVKRATFGPDAGRLLNPHSPDYPQFALHRVSRDRGLEQFEFKPVTPYCFAFYMEFLKSGNEAKLRQAEREI